MILHPCFVLTLYINIINEEAVVSTLLAQRGQVNRCNTIADWKEYGSGFFVPGRELDEKHLTQ